MISFLSSFLYIFPDSKIMFSTCQKANSCPQPAEKQKWYHNPQKTKSSISYREQKKGSLQPRCVMTPDRGNPLKQGFSSLPLCTSCQQYYRLQIWNLIKQFLHMCLSSGCIDGKLLFLCFINCIKSCDTDAEKKIRNEKLLEFFFLIVS